MPETNIKVSTDQEEWGTSVDVVSNKKIYLYFQLNSEGYDQVQFTFPVLGNDDVVANKAITDKDTWEKKATIMKLVEPDSKKAAEPFKTSDGKFTISLKSFKGILKTELYINTIKIDKGSTAVCQVSYFNLIADKLVPQGAEEFTVNVGGLLNPPNIEYFTTSYGAVITSNKFKLAWKVSNAVNITLKIDEAVPLPVDALNNEEYTLRKSVSTYTLAATNAARPIAVEAIVTVYGGDNISVGQIPASEKEADGKLDGKLLNLINDGDKVMYALVLKDKDVWLWTTIDGANWKNTGASFKKKVPLEFAGSSSVFYKGKIYLIGGSRYDVNIRSNSVYYYDLKIPEQGWKEDKAGGSIFTPRMGHAVVVVSNKDNPDGEIYLLGGLGVAETCKDMYIYNEGGGWRKETTTLLSGLCMQNAIYDGKYINMYGGFLDDPGVPDQKLTDFSRYDVLNKSWQKRWEASDPNFESYKWNFMTCAAAIYNNTEFIFGVYRLNAEFHHFSAQIRKTDNINLGIYDVHFIPFKYYCKSVQAITFKNAVWFSVVSDEGTLVSENLGYFLFNG